MSYQPINPGSGPLTGSADRAYTASGKVNANFTDLYGQLATRGNVNGLASSCSNAGVALYFGRLYAASTTAAW